jgi:DNA-binding transcriptional ArsR family regulator
MRLELTKKGEDTAFTWYQARHRRPPWRSYPVGVTSWEPRLLLRDPGAGLVWTTSMDILLFLAGHLTDDEPPFIRIDSQPTVSSLFHRALKALHLSSWRFESSYSELALCFERLVVDGLIKDVTPDWWERAEIAGKMLSALASQTRRSILRYLQDEFARYATMEDLAEAVGLSRATVTKHVRLLTKSYFVLSYVGKKKRTTYGVDPWAYVFLIRYLVLEGNIKEIT